MSRAVLVLPALNEYQALQRLLPRIEQMRRSCPPLSPLKIILVDDGSIDATGTIAEAFPWVHLVRHPQNLGLATALRTGLSAATALAGDSGPVFVMDADDTHDPAAMPAMLAAMQEGAGLVIGSRFTDGGVECGIPWHRRLLSRGAAALMMAACGLAGVRDYTCGFRAYRGDVVRRVLDRQGWVFETPGFSVTVSLLLAAANEGAAITEVPITVHYDRKPGKSAMRALPTIVGTLEAAHSYRLHRRGLAS